jgi:hypothetical protein
MEKTSEETAYINAGRCLNQSLQYLQLALDPKHDSHAKTLVEIAKSYRECADLYLQTAEIEAQNNMKRIKLISRLEKMVSSGIFSAKS